MALNIAATRELPNVKLLNCKIEELEYEPKHFDLIISNKVLAAIPAGGIGSVMDRLCYLGKRIYINELLQEEITIMPKVHILLRTIMHCCFGSEVI